MDDTEGNLSAHQPYDESPGGETPLISNRKSSVAASSAIASGGATSMASPAAAGGTGSSQSERMTPRTEREFVISAPASLLLQRILSHDDNEGAEEYKEDVMTMNGGNIG